MKTREEQLMASLKKFRRKDKESHEPTTWSKRLEGMPIECRFTPLDDRKRPVDPATGSLKTDWQLIDYQAHELDSFNGHVKGVGLMVGEMSGGIAALDFDGPGSEETFEHHFGRSASELPATVTWTSGIPGRYQAAYHIPKEWWGRISLKQLKKPECGDCELRWNHQSAIAGTHPNWEDTVKKTGFGLGPGDGFYSFRNKPTEVAVADAPEWLLEGWARICERGAATPKATDAKGWLSEKAKQALYPGRKPSDALYDASRAREIVLNYLQPAKDFQDYDTWRMVGMVLRKISLDVGEEDYLFDTWDKWSEQMDNYDGEDALYKKWGSFNRDSEANSVKFGTLYEFAKANSNYQGPAQTKAQFIESLPESEKKAVRVEENLQAINYWIHELYRLEKKSGDWHELMNARAQLTRRQVSGEEIDRRLMEMVAEEWGLRITDKGDKPRTTRTLLDTHFDEAELQPLIPGFLHRGSDGVVVADAGVGKTVFALLCSYYTACPGFPFDRKEQVSSALTGRTLWIGTDGGEGAEGMVRKYVEKIKAPGEGVWRSRLSLWCANKSTKETAWALNVRGLHQLFHELNSEQDSDRPYRLVVIDSLKAVLEAGNINFGIGPVGTVMRLMQAAASRFDVSVLWVHHSKEDGYGERSVASGNKNIVQIPYSVIHLYKRELPGHGTVVRCHVKKYRGESSRTFDYTLDEEIGLVKIVDEAAGLQGRLLYEIWYRRDAGATSTDLVKSQGHLQESYVRKKLTELRKAGFVENRKSKWWITTDGAKAMALDHPEVAGEVNRWIEQTTHTPSE